MCCAVCAVLRLLCRLCCAVCVLRVRVVWAFVRLLGRLSVADCKGAAIKNFLAGRFCGLL